MYLRTLRCFVVSLPLTICFANLAQTQAPKQAQRDPAAVAILQADLQALGGASWNNIKGVKITGTRKSSTDASVTPFTWEDHWEGKYKFYRDTFPNGKHIRFLQDEDQQATPIPRPSSSANQKPLLPPVREPATGLLIHLPAAAIAHVLKRPEYIVTVADPLPTNRREGPSDDDCVRIRTSAAGIQHAPVDIILCSSKSTHLPTTARIELQDLIQPGHPLYETIRYSGFSSLGGIMMPSVAVERPTGQIHTLFFTGVSLNPTPDAVAFAGRVQ